MSVVCIRCITNHNTVTLSYFSSDWSHPMLLYVSQWIWLLSSTSPHFYGWPLAIMFCRCSLDLSFFLFFRRLISEVTWPIVTKLCYVVDGDPYLWNSVRHSGATSPEIWRPKNIKFRRDFKQLRDLITNISETQQDIINRLTTFQTTEYGHYRTGKRNSAYCGPQTAKNRTGVRTHPPAIVLRTGVNKSVAFARGHSDFRGGLWKRHVLCNRVRNCLSATNLRSQNLHRWIAQGL